MRRGLLGIVALVAGLCACSVDDAAAARWIAFFKPIANAAGMSGWTVIDGNLFGPSFGIPPGSVFRPGGFFVIEESAPPPELDARTMRRSSASNEAPRDY